jgi:hypothetical protein
MADLKKDLLNDLMNSKYYAEMELVRLAQEPNMNYKKKIKEMKFKLKKLGLLNAEIGLVGQYFQEPLAGASSPSQGTANTVTNPPAGQVHPGQTHGE